MRRQRGGGGQERGRTCENDGVEEGRGMRKAREMGAAR